MTFYVAYTYIKREHSHHSRKFLPVPSQLLPPHPVVEVTTVLPPFAVDLTRLFLNFTSRASDCTCSLVSLSPTVKPGRLVLVAVIVLCSFCSASSVTHLNVSVLLLLLWLILVISSCWLFQAGLPGARRARLRAHCSLSIVSPGSHGGGNAGSEGGLHSPSVNTGVYPRARPQLPSETS